MIYLGPQMLYFYTILGSLMAHVIIWTLMSKIPDLSQSEKNQEVEIIYEKEQPKMLVREVEQKEIDREKNEKARFFSLNTKTVKEEMRARQSGLTQNRANSPSSQTAQPQDMAQGKKQAAREALKPGQIDKNLLPTPTLGGKPLQLPGASTVGQRLPEDVKVGEWTSLNTERYLFYTFFARVEERVRYRWETRVRAVGENTEPRKLARQVWITEIEIVLDRRGHFQKAVILKPCGINGLDQAAAEAFREGSPFLNPPEELLKEDGQFHLKYSISVSYSPHGRM
ncbi:MAG: hypothetical protein AB7F59_13795 [Bdellovibrionales bacterium]